MSGRKVPTNPAERTAAQWKNYEDEFFETAQLFADPNGYAVLCQSRGYTGWAGVLQSHFRRLGETKIIRRRHFGIWTLPGISRLRTNVWRWRWSYGGISTDVIIVFSFFFFFVRPNPFQGGYHGAGGRISPACGDMRVPARYVLSWASMGKQSAMGTACAFLKGEGHPDTTLFVGGKLIATCRYWAGSRCI